MNENRKPSGGFANFWEYHKIPIIVAVIAAALLTPEPVTLTNVPDIRDVDTMLLAAEGFGESVRADELLAAADGPGLGGEALEPMKALLAQANTAFHGPNYDRILLELNIASTDRSLFPLIDDILDAVRSVYGDDFYITGIPMSTYDIGNAFQGDLLKVNIITFLAILLIVSLSFRSFRLPLLLVFVIEGAIWITMGLSFVINRPIFFISYLICVSIQMGATIDYGILLSDQYISMRRESLDAPEALQAAMKKSLPTILTSGTILVTAGYIVGKMCSVFYISDIGSLLSRGAFISALLILSLLPALLVICDRWITPSLLRKSDRS